jgi:PiT family inorganic phosphate transporter
MIRTGITVSTSQAIVGAIIGWNLYAGRETDLSTLAQIVSTWTVCPLISGVVAIFLYLLSKKIQGASTVLLLRT